MSAAAVKELQTARLALIGSARSGRRTLLDMLLSAKGYEIAVCEDGPSVLEFLKENQPAIAIFDHDLPGMDGREICSRMRFITRLAETPIAIVTPAVEEMGGVAEFEGFSDTTTADIVEAEPLGKKGLIERLESVIRDQKGAANAGKMTIAIPTMVPPIPDVDPYKAVEAHNDLDVFVDDDVDIEVDVARAIYSNDANHDQPEVELNEEPAPVEAAEAGPMEAAEAAQVEATDEPVDAPAEYGEELFMQDNPEEADEAAAPQESAAEEFDFFADGDEGIGGRKDENRSAKGDIEWPAIEGAEPEHSDNGVAATEEITETEPMEASSAEISDSEGPERDDERQLELVGVTAETSEVAEAASSDEGAIQSNTLVELETDRVASEPTESPEAVGDEPEYSREADELPAEDPALPFTPEEAVAAEAAALEAEAEDQILSGSHELPIADETPVLKADTEVELADEQPVYAAPQEAAREEVVPAAEYASDREVSDDEDISATIEAAIEAVNLAALEEAEYRMARAEAQDEKALESDAPAEVVPEIEAPAEESTAVKAEAVPAQPEDSHDGVTQAARSEAIDVKSTVEMVVESAESYEPEVEVAAEVEPESAVTEPMPVSANNYADGSDEKQICLTAAEADDQEEGDPAVLNEERSNMQALIDEQAERIENLQQRNVVLRQELEQRRADDALRHEERSNLQALIKEQTEAITNLQQRNVQLRQELDQFKAEEAKRESERTFLQSHTSEQAETIAKLQQLNALLRQELEQRKADEAPLRDFLQRLLDRDEKSAYQEAVRNEIISLGRDNS